MTRPPTTLRVNIIILFLSWVLRSLERSSNWPKVPTPFKWQGKASHPDWFQSPSSILNTPSSCDGSWLSLLKGLKHWLLLIRPPTRTFLKTHLLQNHGHPLWDISFTLQSLFCDMLQLLSKWHSRPEDSLNFKGIAWTVSTLIPAKLLGFDKFNADQLQNCWTDFLILYKRAYLVNSKIPPTESNYNIPNRNQISSPTAINLEIICMKSLLKIIISQKLLK